MKTIYFLILVLFIAISCKKHTKVDELVSAKNGFFIVNEGNFTWGNSSLSFYSYTDDKFYQDAFYAVNSAPLGDVAYSITLYNNKGYIVVNNSGLIYVIGLNDFKYSGKITGLNSPRQIQIINDTLAYVSDLYDTRLARVNLRTNTIIDYIFIGHSCEKMLYQNNKLFVITWSYGNMIYALNPYTGLKIDAATIGKQPNSMVLDKNENIWVMCDGGYNGSPFGWENATLWCLHSSDLTEVKHFTFSDIQMSPIKLCTNSLKDTLYFINNNVYKMNINDNSLPQIPFIMSNQKNFYGMAVNSLRNEVIITDAKNYVANGDVLIYDINGNFKKSFTAGVNPGWIEVMN